MIGCRRYLCQHPQHLPPEVREVRWLARVELERAQLTDAHVLGHGVDLRPQTVAVEMVEGEHRDATLRQSPKTIRLSLEHVGAFHGVHDRDLALATDSIDVEPGPGELDLARVPADLALEGVHHLEQTIEHRTTRQLPVRGGEEERGGPQEKAVLEQLPFGQIVTGPKDTHTSLAEHLEVRPRGERVERRSGPVVSPQITPEEEGLQRWVRVNVRQWRLLVQPFDFGVHVNLFWQPRVPPFASDPTPTT
jgi:hypothetical protein